MSETGLSRTSWRLDRVEAGAVSYEKDAANERPARNEVRAGAANRAAPCANSAGAGLTDRWDQLLGRWISAQLERLTQKSKGFEELIHHFAATIDQAEDALEVEAALLRLARQMAPLSRIELIAVPRTEVGQALLDGSSNPEGSAATGTDAGALVIDLPLRCGGSVCSLLRVRARTERCSPLKPETVRRLATLCTLAAAAMETVGRHAEWPRDDQESQGSSATGRPAVRSSSCPDRHRGSILLHDATFLNAVLPFALNQARRHRESLALLCVAIDRLSGIQELLGHTQVNRLVRHVGETVGSLIRESDIVATLDDDRIVAVLPRAPRGGALRVAERMCRTIAERSPADCEIPRVTVSIGVATSPSCADDVHALFEAADEALAWAQSRGRNQAILAPPLLRAPGPACAGKATI
jgi:diguanylate cyclase (GGDEF)-like protein